MSTIDDLTRNLPADQAEQLRVALHDVAAVADTPAPPPSAPVLALINGGVRRRILRRRAALAAAAGALALGGTSVAAAQNALPEPAQEAIADFADDHLPVSVPHPQQPTPAAPAVPVNPPTDAPGQLRNEPPGELTTPNTDAPGQVQKRTKPAPGAPGPATPADPGSHGRAHGNDDSNAKSLSRSVEPAPGKRTESEDVREHGNSPSR